MVSIKNIFASALIATVAVAQSISSNFSDAQIQGLATGSGGANSPTANQKTSWCRGQISLCMTLCNSNSNNTCFDSTLQYSCVCPNGTSPPLYYYANSIVGNECNALKANCKSNAGTNSTAIEGCDKEFICGAATDDDAKNAASAASQATMTTSAAPSATSGPASTSAPAKNAAAAPAQIYGPGGAAWAVLGAIAVAL